MHGGRRRHAHSQLSIPSAAHFNALIPPSTPMCLCNASLLRTPASRQEAAARARAQAHERLLAAHPELAFPCARPKASSSQSGSPGGSPTALAVASALPWLWDACSPSGGSLWGERGIPTPALVHKPAGAESEMCTGGRVRCALCWVEVALVVAEQNTVGGGCSAAEQLALDSSGAALLL